MEWGLLDSFVGMDLKDQYPEHLFSLKKLEGLTNGDHEAIAHFNRVFISETIEKDLPKLQTLFEAGDLERLRQHAHKMKSSIELYSIDSVATTIRRIEKSSDEPASQGEVQACIQEVISTLTKVGEEIKATIQ